ncbi:MAG TPA: class I SAM-dependent methyltransferase [Bacteroidales bacterium]|nr:class I SAM-dependent methyltransferase [Bacteroidales bacterium]
MQDKHSSRTALVTAYLRAAHQILDSGPCILDDPIALTILGPGAEERIRKTEAKYASDKAKELRAHVILRSRYAEDRLKSSIERGICQYIVIGAGFDTFPRFPEHHNYVLI